MPVILLAFKRRTHCTSLTMATRRERPVLEEIIRNIRENDVLVIWKLDRLGRNLAHLVHLTNKLIEKKVGLISLNDPIDTSTAQGRMIFGIFATLAEFERELIRERTQAGLKSARARGRNGGRPKGMSQSAVEKAAIAEALYKNGNIPVKKIAEQLGISKTTLYLYLRYRNVKIGIVGSGGFCVIGSLMCSGAHSHLISFLNPLIMFNNVPYFSSRLFIALAAIRMSLRVH